MFIQQVKLVVITDFEYIGSNLHTARIALTSVVVDHDLRTRISLQDFDLNSKPKPKTRPAVGGRCN
jgi:hypothetical protein